MEITRTLIALMAEQPARKCGRPATRTQDWETTHKWIRLLNITFEKWRALKDKLKLPNDDSVTSFLLSLYTELKSGNNNSGQRDEPIRRECDLSATFFCHSFSHVILKYIIYFITSFVYRILNGFTSAVLSL